MEGRRVADASAMPDVMRATTNAYKLFPLDNTCSINGPMPTPLNMAIQR